jgi:hypothetical protein
MIRLVLYIAVLIIGTIALPFAGTSSVLFILITGIMIGIALPLLDTIASNTRYLRLAYYSVRYINQDIRMSVSYLFRIKVDSTYMLIKGHRWDQYQPVGGVYKISPGAKHMMDSIGALDDELVPIDEISEHDLRIRIPARKLVTFVRWFESGHSRETSPWREFYEELIGPGILSGNDFPFIFDDFIRRDIRPIRFSTHAQSLEILIADIHELLPTPNQLKALRKLRDTGHPDIIWATENHIRRLGVVPAESLNLRIGEPAIWTL